LPLLLLVVRDEKGIDDFIEQGHSIFIGRGVHSQGCKDALGRRRLHPAVKGFTAPNEDLVVDKIIHVLIILHQGLDTHKEVHITIRTAFFSWLSISPSNRRLSVALVKGSEKVISNSYMQLESHEKRTSERVEWKP